jgi:hypothetical protein
MKFDSKKLALNQTSFRKLEIPNEPLTLNSAISDIWQLNFLISLLIVSKQLMPSKGKCIDALIRVLYLC